jgi:hypothetical protein
VHRALVDRAVAHVGERHAVGIEIFLREGQAGAERDLAADDAVAAVKMFLRVEEMHRAALAARAAGDLAEEFRHAGVGIDAARDGMGVIAISGDDRIVRIQNRNAADRNRFLAVVQMAEALDLGLSERLLRLFLKPANENHLAQKRDFFLGLQLGETGDLTCFRTFNGRISGRHGGEKMPAKRAKIKPLYKELREGKRPSGKSCGII